MKLKHLFILFLLLPLKSINAQNQTDSILIRDIRISPEHALHKRFSEVFESIQYIPLASNKSSEFDINSKIVLDDKRIFVLNYWGEKQYLLIFDNAGNFMNRVNLTKFVDNIFLDYDKKEVFINNIYSTNDMLVYDYNGHPLRKEKNLYQYTYSKSKNNFLSFKEHRYRSEPKEPYDLKMYKEGKLVDSYWRISKDSSEIFSGGELDAINMSGQQAIISPIYDYHIYVITDDKIKNGYQFIFPHHLSLPENFINDSAYFKKKKEYRINNPLAITQIRYPFTDGNNFTFKLPSWGLTTFTDMLYNLNTDILINLRQLQPDSLTNYLPIFEDSHFSTSKNIVAADGHYFYSLISPSSLLDAYELNSINGISTAFPKGLGDIIKKKKYVSNYILVKMKIKTEIQ